MVGPSTTAEGHGESEGIVGLSGLAWYSYLELTD